MNTALQLATSSSEQPLVAAFPDHDSAENAAKLLRREGFRKQSLGPTGAQRVERQPTPNDVILSVGGSNHPELAAWIVEHAGGTIIAGESFGPNLVDWRPAGELRGSTILGYQDPSAYARGKRVDEDDRQRLRSERLLGRTIPTVHGVAPSWFRG